MVALRYILWGDLFRHTEIIFSLPHRNLTVNLSHYGLVKAQSKESQVQHCMEKVPNDLFYLV